MSVLTSVLCGGCGEEFETTTDPRYRKKYCSKACAARANRYRNIAGYRERARAKACKVYFEVCDVCGELRSWRTPRRRDRACSTECVNALKALRARERYLEDGGASERERLKAWRRTAQGRSRQKTYKSSRRARERDAFVEDVSLDALLARDDYICGLCSDPIDPSCTFPSHDCATVDHVVPLSLGGEHSYANTQPAHYSCNARKGNRVDQEVLHATSTWASAEGKQDAA